MQNWATAMETQTFSFKAPRAMRVQLAGDFTHWQKRPLDMRKGEDGIWRTTVELSPGEHHYRFLVDGQWRDDPECPQHAPESFRQRGCYPSGCLDRSAVKRAESWRGLAFQFQWPAGRREVKTSYDICGPWPVVRTNVEDEL